MTTEPANDAPRMRKSIERGIMGRVVLCFACVCITNIQQMAGKIVTTSAFLVPVAGFGFTFCFKTSSCHMQGETFFFQLQPSLPCTLQLLPEAAGPGRVNS